MEDNSVTKCRTCLKRSTKTFPLNKMIMGSQSMTTYGQLLKECTSLEYPAVYEHLMPQYLCSLCYQELNRAYSFIQQAQYCNNKLINLIVKRLRKSVASPQNELLKVNIHQNKGNENNLYNTINNEFRIVSSSALLQPIDLEEMAEDYKPIQSKDEEYNEEQTVDSSSFYKTNTAPPIPTATCPICEKATNSHNSLISHMRIQHDILPARNLLNKRNTLNPKGVETNIKSKPKERTFKCSSCNYIARTYMAINLHNRSKHGSEADKFKCNFCLYTTWTKFKLFMHVKKSHKEEIKALKSDSSNRSASFRNYMNANEKNEACDENENFSSSVCSTPVTQMVIKATTFDDQEVEELSDELFIRNLLNIKKRQNQTKSTNLLPRRCDECGNIYNNIQALKNHKRNVHVSEEQYSPCPHCGKKFKKRGNMRVHVRNAHNPDSIKIRKKLTKQTKEKCFLCSQCSYVCVTKSLLTHHVNRHHTGEKPYKCDICNKAFVVAFDLKIHRYIHTGERPYKCSICSKRFRCSVHLVKHKRIHNNERPYKCKDCDKSFTQSYNLTLHKKIHIKEKNFKCMVCNKFFDSQSLLNTHRIKENHYDEIE